jgi:hypothetical protein
MRKVFFALIMSLLSKYQNCDVWPTGVSRHRHTQNKKLAAHEIAVADTGTEHSTSHETEATLSVSLSMLHLQQGQFVT